MHDLDRTQMEGEAYEQEVFELGQEFGAGAGEQFFGRQFGEFGEAESPLNEVQEMELATELLEVTNEQELEQFLGNVLRTVGQAAGGFLRSDTGRQLTGILRGAARQALPVVGQAVGSWVSPSRGGAVGRRLATSAGQILGLELEGLSPQDQEFEAARQFVRFAGTAANHALNLPPNVPAAVAARNAAQAAAQAYAPGLLRLLGGGVPRSGGGAPAVAGGQASGRWVRRGNAVVLFGL
jgi:hypothetical protein